MKEMNHEFNNHPWIQCHPLFNNMNGIITLCQANMLADNNI